MKKKVVLGLVCVLSVTFFLIGCEQPSNNTTLSLGSGFTFNAETILTPTGENVTELNADVTAFVNKNKIASGKIENVKLTITIPPVNETYLTAQLNNEDSKFDFSPADVKTGELVLEFSNEGTTYELIKGNYNSTYKTFNNLVSYVYCNKEVIQTGSFTETDKTGSLPVTLKVTAKAHFLTGWNKANTKQDITASNTEINSFCLLTTEKVDMVNNWYYQVAE